MSDRTTTERRTARVAHDSNGDPLGAAVYLSAVELTALGVDPETATRVAYAICKQRLTVTAATTEAEDA